MYENYNNNYTSGNYTGEPRMGNQDSWQEPPRREENHYNAYDINRSTSHIPPEPPKKEKKGKLWKRALACMVLGIVFGVFAGTGWYAVSFITNAVSPDQEKAITQKQETQQIQETQTTTTSIQDATVSENEEQPVPAVSNKTTVLDVSGVVDEVMPSVVSITNMYTETANFFGQEGAFQNESSGSGFIIGENDTELLIATNNHVVADTDTLSVQFIDETTVEAQIKGTEADVDLAVIAVPLSEIPAETRAKIKIATLGDSDSIRVGEPAIAIGNALGYGQSVTSGVISALNREVTVDEVTSELIQTDAAINPGNSGGALLNSKGEVIGINAVKYAASGVEGMGYAIPISKAKPIFDELMNRETKTKVSEEQSAYLGISGVDVTQEASQTYGMPMGVYIAQVGEGTAAEKGGLKKGDIITEFDGESISTMVELQRLMQYYPAGSEVAIKLQEAGSNGYTEKTITVTLGKKTS